MVEFTLPTGGGPEAAFRTSSIGTGGEVAYGSTPFVDTFEDGDLNGWRLTSGNSANFSADTTRAYEGSYSARFNFYAQCNGSSAIDSYAADNPGMQYPEPGDTVEAYVHPLSLHDRSFKLGVGADENNFYIINDTIWNDALRLQRHLNGNRTTLAERTQNVTSNTWNVFRFEWGTDGTLTGSINGTEVVATDTEITTGGFVRLSVYNGCGGNTDSVWWDYPHIV